jgi:autotransporter-associated beta strand protein
VDVTVLTGGGNSAASSADWFRYVAPPAISSIGTTSGSVFGDTPVNIYGSNLADATTAVYFGTTPAASFSVISASELLAYSPPGLGLGTVNVTVVTVGGSSQVAPADRFTYVPVTLAWDGAATGNWTDTQWSGPVLPYPDDRANAVIGSGSFVRVASPQAANALSIQSGAELAVGPGATLSITTDTTVTGGSVLSVDPNGSFSSSGTVTVDTGSLLSGGPVTAAAYQLDYGTVSADLSGHGGLTKGTGGRVVLSGVNTYAGGTVVNDGTLVVTNPKALPTGSSLMVGAAAIEIFASAPAAASASAAGPAATAAASVAASETSTTIVAAGSPSSPPVTASTLSTVTSTPTATPLAPAESPAPPATALLRRREARAATPPAISPLAIDAVIKADHSAVERSVASPDLSPSAGPWAWFVAADKNRANGMTVAALDKVLAQYGVPGTDY